MDFPLLNPVDQHLFDRRIVQMSGPVSWQLAYEVNKKLLALEKVDSKKPIFLFIDSPGGEINSGFSIYDIARFIEPEVHTVVVGLAASMGSLIALCAKKEHRYALPNAKLLIHQPLISGVLQGQASDIEIHARDIIKVKERINKIYSQETGRTIEEIQKLTDRDHWLDAEEAQKLGLITRIVKSKSELSGLV